MLLNTSVPTFGSMGRSPFYAFQLLFFILLKYYVYIFQSVLTA